MPLRILLCLGLCALHLLLSSCATYLERVAQQAEQLRSEPAYALVGVNLIPVERPGVEYNQTLLVKGGKIVAMGPTAELEVPAGYQRLSLAGNYVLPGFSDMHVHLAQEQDLLLFLRSGITQVRNMGDSVAIGKQLGFPHVPALRDKVQAGQLPGPDIFACGPFLDGDPPQFWLTTPVRNPQEARQQVLKAKAGGFDCIKVYNRLKRPEFEAIVETAREQGIPVMGHVPFDVGIDGALAARMTTIEHLNAYVENFAGHYRIPPESWQAYVRKTAEAGIYNCPTLVIWDQHPPYQNYDKVVADPRYARLPGYLQLLWYFSVPELFNVPFADKVAYPQALLSLSKPMVKALYEGGAPLLIGTDANLPMTYPGSSALREMELFAESGIPNAAILEAATLNAAKVLKKEQQTGSLRVGKRAQLVVLRENPLADIRAVNSTVGVLAQGHWWSVQQLDALLEQANPEKVLADRCCD